MSTQPEALRLADALDDEFTQGRISNDTGRKSAAELRRLALKQWVGLTDKDIDDCYFAARQPDFDIWAFAQEVEEVLKQKNT